MAVPSYVRRCVHMVAAHEPRGSFPLDLIDSAPDGRDEIVYPGVHSDVGGGYGPGEQGRGSSDADKLSQVPLLDMYRAARAAGVPLDVSAAGSNVLRAFQISPALKTAFANYVKTSKDYAATPEHGTAGLMRAHYGLYLRWRRMRLDNLRAQPGFKAASAAYPQDGADLDSANEELKTEWQDLLECEKNGGPTVAHYARKAVDSQLAKNPKTVAFVGPALLPALVGLAANPLTLPLVQGGSSAVKFFREQIEEKWKQWCEVRDDWNSGPPAAAISALYDGFMHDSRAWFKPLGDDDDVWNHKQIKDLKQKQAQFEREHAQWKQRQATGAPGTAQIMQMIGAGSMGLGPSTVPLPDPEPRSPLSAQESAILSRYDAAQRAAQQARAAKQSDAPNDSAVLTDPKVTGGLALQDSGREFYFVWGYLRWRTVFINGVRWDAPHVPTASEEWEAQRELAKFNVDMSKMTF
jgi:hypothetical protein